MRVRPRLARAYSGRSPTMSPQEFEQALHDAEIKLAHLKALYKQ